MTPKFSGPLKGSRPLRVVANSSSTCATMRRAFSTTSWPIGVSANDLALRSISVTAEILFELSDLRAQSGLGYVALLRRASKMRAVRQSH